MEIVIVALHTFIIYLFLILAISLLGHRQSAQLNIVELVVIMVLGSAVETSMVAGDTSLIAGLTSATTLLVSNRLLSMMMDRWRWLRGFVVGRPVLLVHNGQILDTHMLEAGLSEDDLQEALRERGYNDLKKVRFAVLEMDGKISVVPQN